jgi:hypothetical protein
MKDGVGGVAVRHHVTGVIAVGHRGWLHRQTRNFGPKIGGGADTRPDWWKAWPNRARVSMSRCRAVPER